MRGNTGVVTAVSVVSSDSGPVEFINTLNRLLTEKKVFYEEKCALLRHPGSNQNRPAHNQAPCRLSYGTHKHAHTIGPTWYIYENLKYIKETPLFENTKPKLVTLRLYLFSIIVKFNSVRITKYLVIIRPIVYICLILKLDFVVFFPHVMNQLPDPLIPLEE